MYKKLLKFPKFWHKRTLPAYLLVPFSFIYYFCFILKKLCTKQYTVSATTLCIGGLTIGGAGKTPSSIALASLLSDKYKTAIVCRGYLGSLSTNTPIKVNLKQHTAKEIGDEAMLLAEHATTFICKNKFLACLEAEKQGYTYIIIDDGLQHFNILPDKKILIIDGQYGLGNGFLFPAGPLRENFKDNFDAVIIIGNDDHNVAKKFSKSPVFFARTQIIAANIYKCIAFTAIARPEKFFDSLRELNIDIVKEFTFPNHHFFNTKEIQAIVKTAKKLKLDVVTTEKDATKLSKKNKKLIKTIKIEIKIERYKELLSILNCIAKAV